ncbi:MAG TPA: hypothetical protein VNG32_00015 [Candidatus Dormibacteraeota bacterium]|nr:hypothetical protein [Candidatus Dormibacteraeota bacterium]
MDIVSFSEQEIEITAVYFRHGRPNKKRFESFPRRMVYDGREYTFVEEGLRYLVQKGQELVKLFDVSDGQNQYRLRLDPANRWTLVGVKNSI